MSIQNLISVIIPVYNAARTVTAALQSVINQTTGSYEVILVNDGSKDDSLAVINEFIKENTRDNISYKVVDQANGGVSRARNAALRQATGDYIAFLDSDDEWLPNKTARQLEAIALNPEIDYLAGRISPAPLRSNFLKKFDEGITQIYLRDLIFKNYFQPSTVIFKKKVLDTIGLFREDQTHAEEGNYFMRIANQFNCYLLDEQVIVYGDGKAGYGASGLSANLKEMERGELMNLWAALKNKYIGIGTYIVAVLYSLVKYARRILVASLRK